MTPKCSTTRCAVLTALLSVAVTACIQDPTHPSSETEVNTKKGGNGGGGGSGTPLTVTVLDVGGVSHDGNPVYAHGDPGLDAAEVSRGGSGAS